MEGREQPRWQTPIFCLVNVLADGQDTGKTLELTEANGWAGSFKDLDADKVAHLSVHGSK